jgi:hypothetical protein
VWLYSLLFYFFIGVREFATLHLGGCAVGEKTASILSKWLWYWLFNIMLLCDSLCGWMLA